MAADYLEVYRRLKYFEPDAIEQAAQAFGASALSINGGGSHPKIRPRTI
jgi:hypothetical protein